MSSLRKRLNQEYAIMTKNFGSHLDRPVTNPGGTSAARATPLPPPTVPSTAQTRPSWSSVTHSLGGSTARAVKSAGTTLATVGSQMSLDKAGAHGPAPRAGHG